MWKSMLIIIILFVVFISILIFLAYRSSCCPNCKKRGTMKECGRKAIKRSKRSQDLGNGKRRYYSLVTYKVIYKCENCGATRVHTREVEED